MFRASWLHSSGTTFGCWVFFAFESIFEARDVLARKASFTKPDWLLAINKAATEFLRGRRWAPVFHQCGVIGDRTGLKGFLSTMAAKYKEVEPAPVMPSPSIISALLPRNRSISYKDLLPEH